ncbi:hypothetical protein [Algoriphagus sp.]|nr:hypothetical protein [Algoriphagus sp.]
MKKLKVIREKPKIKAQLKAFRPVSMGIPDFKINKIHKKYPGG